MIKVVRVELIPRIEGLTKKEVYELLLAAQKEAVEIANKLARIWYLKTAEAFDIYKREKALNKKAKMAPILKEMLGGKSMLSYLNALYALKNLPDDEQYTVSTRCVAAIVQGVLKKMNALSKDILTFDVLPIAKARGFWDTDEPCYQMTVLRVLSAMDNALPIFIV